MRLFVSLPLDDAMRRHAGAVADAISVRDDAHDIRWVPPQNLHVTLKFLGEVADAEVPAVADALRALPSPGPVRIAVGAPDPRRHRGRVHLITAEVIDAGGNLALLRESIEVALEPLGFAREKRAFWPHVTLGRSRQGVRMTFERFATRGVVSKIGHFDLMSSRLSGSTPSYIPVATFRLE